MPSALFAGRKNISYGVCPRHVRACRVQRKQVLWVPGWGVSHAVRGMHHMTIRSELSSPLLGCLHHTHSRKNVRHIANRCEVVHDGINIRDNALPLCHIYIATACWFMHANGCSFLHHGLLFQSVRSRWKTPTQYPQTWKHLRTVLQHVLLHDTA